MLREDAAEGASLGVLHDEAEVGRRQHQPPQRHDVGVVQQPEQTALLANLDTGDRSGQEANGQVTAVRDTLALRPGSQ